MITLVNFLMSVCILVVAALVLIMAIGITYELIKGIIKNI